LLPRYRSHHRPIDPPRCIWCDSPTSKRGPSMKLEKLNIAGWIAALAVGLFAGASPGHAQTSDRSIRPFTVQVPQAALNDLRRRIARSEERRVGKERRM